VHVKIAALASVAMLLPANAFAETVRIACTMERLDKDGASLGTQPLTLAYEGDGATGVLIAGSPWGEITFPYAEYSSGDTPGDYKIVGNWPATILMPDMPALMACLQSKGRRGDLMFLDTLSQFVEECRVAVPDGKEPAPANVEMTVEVTGGAPDVYIVRTYEEESEVSGHHIDIVSLPQPKCVVSK
jgi:hypothetical protein